jgi:hypothetical protein
MGGIVVCHWMCFPLMRVFGQAACEQVSQMTAASGVWYNGLKPV